MRKAQVLASATLVVAAAIGITTASHAHDGRSSWKRARHEQKLNVQVGPRPYYLVDDMDEGPLKDELQRCSEGPFETSDFSIAHRGAPLQFPEHTREGYEAAARMGAGIIECDVTFTKDRQLVCRHSQCDLHTTTNILAIPELAAKCTQPFSPADAATGKAASANCCTSDITLAEFRQLRGKMDASNPRATTVSEYLGGTADWRTDLYAARGTLLTHKEYIALVDDLGLKFTPELKSASVKMPFDGDYTQAKYAQQMIDEYKSAGISPKRVWPQSFALDDVLYWIAREPRFGKQAVFLDSRVDTPAGYDQAVAGMSALARQGVKIVAPPMFALVRLDGLSRIVPSEYARAARKSGLDIISWSFERAGPLAGGGGYYYQYVAPMIDNDGDMYKVLDVLATQVGILGMFSDWPGTTTYYANCMGL